MFVFEPAVLGASTSGTFRPGLYFDGSAYGFGNDVGGLQVADPPANGTNDSGEAAPGLGGAAPDGLMVIMDVEPLEVLGPMTLKQWQALTSSVFVLAPLSDAPEIVVQEKVEPVAR